MSFPYREKMNNLRTGDIFEKDGVVYAALSGPSYFVDLSCCTMIVTIPKIMKEKMIFDGDFDFILAVPEEEVEVVGVDINVIAKHNEVVCQQSKKRYGLSTDKENA